ncbi:MAG: NAD(P)/FAD-dependent oxidoreductase [Phycisphaerae bacterium]
MPTRDISDVLVLGAGPAGLAAAAFARAKALSVTLVDRADAVSSSRRLEWIHPQTYDRLKAIGVRRADVSAGLINTVRFVELAQGRSGTIPIDPPVDLVATDLLLERLRAAAESSGADLRFSTEIAHVGPEEEVVALTSTSGATYRGRFLIAADGHEAWAARQLGICGRARSDGEACCHEYSWMGRSTRTAQPLVSGGELVLVLAPAQPLSFGFVWRGADRVAAGWVSDPADIGGQGSFIRFLMRCVDGGVLPVDLPIDPREVFDRPVPRGVALDLETHVGKRSVVIGDAGGFVAALSQQGLLPAIWSASLAVETCAEAMESSQPQDALAEFDRRWREEMVTFLRLPNVDLRFVLPLVFSNSRMATKMARAFLLGENF